jgi:NAD(P)-dependent dehydrogenase (short-subunit alcohol dehydrogenase family)
MPRPLEEAVVVITGASSGIGRAAALRLARRGSSLVLAGRSEEPLNDVVAECGGLGAEAIAVPVDVGDEDAVEGLAAAAVERFGRVDVWVNGAAVIAYGRFEELPAELFRRQIDVNLMGQVHGARAALKRFREQGQGVLINMSSVWGRVTTPQVAAYSVSKHAVRAFSECLRHELGDSDIHVATMLPQAVDTPIFEHAANYSGRRVTPIPPIIDPDEVAEGIEMCAENPKREVTYGRTGRFLEIVYALAPRLYCRIAPAMFTRGSFEEGQEPATEGNLLAPRAPHRVDGGWRGDRARLRRSFLNALRGGARSAIGRGGS